MFNSVMWTPNLKTVSHQGGVAANRSPELELTLLVTSNLLGDGFYEKQSEKTQRFIELTGKVKPDFLQKLAVFSRQTMNIRSASTSLLGVYALNFGRPSILAEKGVFVRGDELLEFFATVKSLSKKKTLTKAAKETASSALNSLSERQVLRYLGGSKPWKLSDVIRLAHPRPASAKQAALFNYLTQVGKTGSNKKAWEVLTQIEQSLLPVVARSFEYASEVSWERAMSEGGKTWPDVIDGMGYMATLRNLRNFLDKVDYQDKAFWDTVISRISNKEEVVNSRQLFYRFWSALKAIAPFRNTGRGPELVVALTKAFEYSLESIPTLHGKTLVVVDESGSMTQARVSEQSEVYASEIACLFGAAAQTAFKADLVTFATNARKHVFNPSRSTLDKAAEMISQSTGGGTYLNQVSRIHANDFSDYENIILLSDMQLADKNMDSAFTGFQGNIFSFDLTGAGPGFALSNKKNCFTIGGFSDASLKLISEISNGGVDSMLNKINSTPV